MNKARNIYIVSQNTNILAQNYTEKYSFRRFIDAGVVAPLIDSDHRAVFGKLRVKMILVKLISRRQKTMHLDHSCLHNPRN